MSAKHVILVVEDEPFIGLALCLEVEDTGAEVIGPIASVEEALELLARETVTAAIIDANLLDRDVAPVALLLIERDVPFVIHTGTGLPAELAAVAPNVALVMKPAAPKVVIARLLAECGRKRA